MIESRAVAIGVPCFNEAARIAALGDVIASLHPAPGAVFAVDDGSSDGTAEALRVAGFEVLVHEVNSGLGTARNTLWRRALDRGFQAIAFLDADVAPPKDYLRRVCELLAQGRVAGVGGRNVDDGSDWVDAWRGRFFPQSLGDRDLIDAPMLVGACATYRVAALRDVGGFSPRFRTHGEDVDIGRRLRAGGHRLRYDPTVVVRHRRSDSAETLVRNCYHHCREGMRATLATRGLEPGPPDLVLGMAKKAVRAPVAALVRRRDAREAALGAAACGAALAGYAAGLLRPR